MFKNKRILLICKETYSYPLYYLAKDWGDNNVVASYFFNPAECMFNKSILNENTYYKHIELNNLKVFDSKEIVQIFTKNIKNPKVDMDYINHIEEKYTHFKNINLQLLSTQKMSTYYHDRIYYSNSTNNQQLYWIELNYKRALEIIDTFRPDVIIDTDSSELARTVINEIAYSKGIPYITIEYPRYELYKIPAYDLGNCIDKNFELVYKEKLRKPDESLLNECNYVNQFRKKNNIMSSEYTNDVTSKYEIDGIYTSLKTIFGMVLYFWNQDITAKNLRIKIKNNILFAPSIRYILFYVIWEIRKRYLFGKSALFSDPNKDDKYVYMPLHLIPESSTLTKSPFYINELMVIEQVSKSLPAGWVLYVKEHQSMIGQRSLKFYKKVNSLHNAKMVTLNFHKDPKPWIENAKGVITITGTSAYEAALLGKRSIVFGEVSYNLIEGISRIHSFEELPSLIASFGPIDNIKSCAAYIAAVKSVGTKINLKYLMAEGEAILKGDKILSDEYQKQIDQLSEFYEKAYVKYKETI